MTSSKTKPEQPQKGGSYVRDKRSGKLNRKAHTAPAEIGNPQIEAPADAPDTRPTEPAAAAPAKQKEA